jgi:hypothetical protein
VFKSPGVSIVVFFFQNRLDQKTGEEIGDMLQEFKEFAMRGNLIDLAIGIVIGGALARLSLPLSMMW